MANTAVSINWSEINYCHVVLPVKRPVVLGYIFTLKIHAVNGDYNTGAAYTVNADPVEGRGQHFFMDKEHVIHFRDRQAATETDPVFEENRP